MKKAKIISIIIVMVSVIALGVLMGKQVFRLMEAGNSVIPTEASATNSTTSEAESVPTDLNSTVSTALTTNNVVKTEEAPSLASRQPVSNYVPPKPVVPKETSIIADIPTSPAVSETNKIAKIDSNRMQPMQAFETSIHTESPAPKTEKTPLQVIEPSTKTIVFANGSGINVRTGPSTREKMLFKVGSGTKGVAVERKNGWTHILWDFNKQKGWVRDDLLNFSETAPIQVSDSTPDKSKKIVPIKKVAPENIIAVAIAVPADISETTNTYKAGDKLPEEAIINAETFANIRNLPTTGSDKVAKLPKGMVVKVKNVKKEGRWQWFEVVFQAGRKTGWTREDNLRFQ